MILLVGDIVYCVNLQLNQIENFKHLVMLRITVLIDRLAMKENLSKT